jgi:putative transposase
VVTPTARREAARYLRQAYEISERRACRVIGTDRTSVRYQGVRPADDALRERLKALAEERRRRFGYRRLDLPPEEWTPGYADFASACSGVM